MGAQGWCCRWGRGDDDVRWDWGLGLLRLGGVRHLLLLVCAITFSRNVRRSVLVLRAGAVEGGSRDRGGLCAIHWCGCGGIAVIVFVYAYVYLGYVTRDLSSARDGGG